MNLLSNRFFYFSLFISVGVIAKTIRARHRKRRILNFFASRQVRTPDEFAAAFFPPEHVFVAATVRRLLEKTLAMDLGGLLPEDSFCNELKFDEMNRELFQKFLGKVEDAFTIATPPVDDCLRLSFAELVALICKKREEDA